MFGIYTINGNYYEENALTAQFKEKVKEGAGEAALRLSSLAALPEDPRWTQNPQGSSQPFVRPVTGDLKPSSGLQGHQACTRCTTSM